MKFDIFESVKDQGQLCTNELFLDKTYSRDLVPLWNRIADCTDKDEQQNLKRRLPGVTWQAHFPSGRRVNAEAEPSGLYMVDIDGIEEPARVYNDRIAGRLTELDILAVHITPSCHGLRLVAMCRPEFTTIEENQNWMAAKLDLQIDSACKDMARFSYLVPQSYFLYWDGSIWDREPMALCTNASDSPNVKVPEKPVSAVSVQDSFKDMPLCDIAAKWLELNGGEPQPGERNTVLFELATRMRYICEFQPETIASNIPHCGLSDTEVLALCKSACATQRSTKMPSDLKMVLKNVCKSANDTSVQEEEDDNDDEDFLLCMPRLPIGLKESLQGVPDKVKMPILCGIMPLAMSYATSVRVRYCDGKEQRLNCMSIIYGRQASGKSSVKDVIDVWKRPMKEADAIFRKAEDEFRQLRKNRKSNEKLPEEPHNPILEVPITISCSTLLKRMKNAGDRHLFSFGEELDTLRKTNGAGSWSSKYDVYRLSFDNGEWGQDFNSDNAESGVVRVAYNWTVLGTLGAVDKCFKGESVENGMSGRVLFAKMPSARYEYMPSFGDKIKLDEDRIIEATHILGSVDGFIDTPKLRKRMEAWCNARADDARNTKDEVLDTFRKRAAVIGFRCAVVYQLLENGSTNAQWALGHGVHKESRNSLDFAELMAEYALKYQTELFGKQLLEVNVTMEEATGRQTKNKTLFAQLPETFTFQMLQDAKPDAKYPALRMMVSIWKRQGMITSKDMNTWQKVGKE